MGAALLDYSTLDVKAYWEANRFIAAATSMNSVWNVQCPWDVFHADPVALMAKLTMGKTPKFSCPDENCKQKSFKDVLVKWPAADFIKILIPSYKKMQVPWRALGISDNGYFHYQASRNGDVVSLPASKHTDLELMRICTDPETWKKYAGGEQGISWKKAARQLMDSCQEKGFYKKASVRGAGIFFDRKRLVVNLGKCLLVDGVQIPLHEFDGEFIYASHLNIDLPDPISKEALDGILPLMEKLPFAHPGQATILLGQIIAGYISGALKWRPHTWLTGEYGTGKSTILNLVAGALSTPLGGGQYKGDVTAAGSRDDSKNSSTLMIFDEMTADGRPTEANRIQQIIAMLRSASETSTAKVAKGDPRGEGKQWQLRLCGLLCSIHHSVTRAEDFSRFCFISTKPSQSKMEEKEWVNIDREIQKTFTPDSARRLFALVVKEARFILSLCDYFSESMISFGTNRRECDQWGTIMACAWWASPTRTPRRRRRGSSTGWAIPSCNGWWTATAAPGSSSASPACQRPT